MGLDSLSANPRYRLLSEQILDARGEDITIAIAGRRAARAPPPTRSCPRRRAPAPSSTCRPRRTSSPTYWNASQAIAAVQLAVGANSPYLLGKELWRETRIPLFEQATDTRSEELKAQGVRPAGVVRRALDHLGLRPVRGERPLLPGAAADHRGRGPARGPRGRRHPAARRAAAAQRHDLPLEPPGLRHRRRRAAPARREPRSSPPARRSPTRSPTPRSTSGWCAPSPRASGRCGRRCRSAPRRRTSTSPPSRASTRRSTGPGVGQVRATELVLRRLLPMAHEGLDAWGVGARGARPAARHHRAALPDRGQRRRVVRAPDGPAGRPGPVRRAAGHAAGVPRAACTPTSRSTPGTDRHAAQRRGAASSVRPGAAARVAPAVPGDHDHRQRQPGLGARPRAPRPARRRRRPAGRGRRAGSARPAAPAPARARREQGRHDVGAQGVVQSARPARARRPPAGRPGVPTCSTGGKAARRSERRVVEHRPAQQRRAAAGRRGSTDSFHGDLPRASLPASRPARAPLVHRLPRRARIG